MFFPFFLFLPFFKIIHLKQAIFSMEGLFK